MGWVVAKVLSRQDF